MLRLYACCDTVLAPVGCAHVAHVFLLQPDLAPPSHKQAVMQADPMSVGCARSQPARGIDSSSHAAFSPSAAHVAAHSAAVSVGHRHMA